jgi:deazaflavin-dependent oxidoreductase (nitroreductase family)
MARAIEGTMPAMTVQVPPNGTKGLRMPRLLTAILHRMALMMLARYRRRHGDLKLRGQPLVLLATIGAKSGQRRETLIERFPDGTSQDSWIVTATAGGTPTHPAWFFNMAKHPDHVWLEIDDKVIHVRPETLEGPDYDAAWARIVEIDSTFAGYPTKTDRRIPVIRLTAADERTPAQA